MQQILKQVLKSTSLASLFVVCAYGESVEYYSTHKQEREKTLKKCEALILNAMQQGKELSKEQKSMCGNAERAQGLARRHAEEDVYRELRQRIKAW
ncbi:hypothetical protein, partial [Helicobacter labacensis]|uniref:hypothetical protein n=1 Tax=Helicobacter labacensis TaxID=2316079 RepID=UPI0019696EB7